MLLARISVYSNPLGPPVRLWYWSVHAQGIYSCEKVYQRWVGGGCDLILNMSLNSGPEG